LSDESWDQSYLGVDGGEPPSSHYIVLYEELGVEGGEPTMHALPVSDWKSFRRETMAERNAPKSEDQLKMFEAMRDSSLDVRPSLLRKGLAHGALPEDSREGGMVSDSALHELSIVLGEQSGTSGVQGVEGYRTAFEREARESKKGGGGGGGGRGGVGDEDIVGATGAEDVDAQLALLEGSGGVEPIASESGGGDAGQRTRYGLDFGVGEYVFEVFGGVGSTEGLEDADLMNTVMYGENDGAAPGDKSDDETGGAEGEYLDLEEEEEEELKEKADLEVEGAHPAKRQRTDFLATELVSFLTSQGGSATGEAMRKNFKKHFKKHPELKDQLKEILASQSLTTKGNSLDGKVVFHLKKGAS